MNCDCLRDNLWRHRTQINNFEYTVALTLAPYSFSHTLRRLLHFGIKRPNGASGPTGVISNVMKPPAASGNC